MKHILGLDLGTNSIGWALVKEDFENKQGEILGLGSRIIPMSQDILGEFGRGNSISQTAERTGYRGVRRLRERHLLRRERLHRVLNILGFLPKHYAKEIDFTKRFGKFINHAEPKLSFDKEFIFKDSFNEMLKDFQQNHPDFIINKHGEETLVPYDWTIYYLRKKALTHKIDKEELAWIILNFNQKRGYYQLRGEEEEDNPNKLVEFYSLKIIDVVADEEVNKKGEVWYSLHLENGWIYRRSSKISLIDWKDKIRDFIVTTDVNDDGSEKLDKEGVVKRSFRAPSADDWTLLKKKTEQDIDNSNKTVGTYIYENLLLNPKQKIKGKLVRTIERKFYKDELKLILEKQKEFHQELQNEQLLQNCVCELYKHNKQHQQMLESKDFVHLFLNDIIFYQRSLRSQKSLISNCTLEKRVSKDGVIFPIKVISKSNPYYQEFRLLQWLQNLAIYRRDNDLNVTQEFLNSIESWESLLQFLNAKKEIKQEQLIKFLLEQKGIKGNSLKTTILKYRWNYVTDKIYPMNETRYLIQDRLKKVENVPTDFLSFDNEMALWHIIYSVNDKIEYEKALAKFASKHNLDETSFVESFKKFPPFNSDYGSFSEKAIKKLLPLMRFGSIWNKNNIVPSALDRIDKILTGEYDEKIKNRVREKAEQFQLNQIEDFKNLPLWLAQYIVYDRHSEAEIARKWNSVKDLENYLKEFKQHSLRNPIVEQVITETLRVVNDIWQQYGKGVQNFFDEIHIELGREMKNTADERKRITNSIAENENTNLRIKALLVELKEDTNIENVRPHSPMHQEILKIYEEGVLNTVENIEDDILKISKTAQPSKSELIRYKLWLEQKYQSPYTGEIIPLNRLFTSDYEIEHVIPQSRYFDDSMSNKVICESAVNKRKDNQLGLEFIKNHHSEKIELGNGKTAQVLEIEAYESFVKKNYDKNRGKRNKLLLEDVPEKMIERQLNDTRYISKFITHLLSNIVRRDEPNSNDNGINSKNVIPGNGKITTQLKQDWGLNDVWNELILPRFERMNTLTNTTDFTSTNTNGRIIPTVPLEYSKGFSKKRIDHRHHALDALVIALATRDHVNLLNNESALPKKGRTKDEQKSFRFDLQVNLRNKEKYFNAKEGREKERFTTFKKPWNTFTQDTRDALENVVVSFKQNLRVINKATNYYESYTDENGNLRLDKNGNPKKGRISQKGTNWAIRKSMHAETVSGLVHLPWVKLRKGEKLTATRERNDLVSIFKDIKSFDIALAKIEKITDTGIQKILKNYIEQNRDKLENALSAEGLEELNTNIIIYNDGKLHQPILKVRSFEKSKGRFPVGETGNKTTKFVEAAKGTNLFFGIYQDKIGKRSYDTIPLNLVIERQKQGLSPVPETNEKGHQLLFHLSPNDLVYVPTIDDNNQLDSNRIYKMVSSTGNECHFIKANISSLIKNYDAKTKLGEMGSLNKLEVTIEGDFRIKEVCIKLKIDRLGNISKA
ncbi:type II CRISPR RNA-guided endonuclease Cas9 [Myroides odoratimimus]|uniref:type II CRISPR RNA-guided endonuclease Cas9 n=1 Tax=Myroides odoratimimus TaxID=76832 RepID=UPI002574A9C7|nr:type II CRISPR RNA-guided endonuclease Cas9 [Myroides odoratimimus]MDM1483856.1 type II CRISPR RNA-guided endonuclease Cas9 [Myroides odoratimimus]